MIRELTVILILALGLTAACGSAEERAPSVNRAASNQAVNASEVGVPASPQNSTTNRTIVDVDEKESITSTPPPGAKPYEREAPEDSTYTSSLGTTALEVRTFKKHPQILKVEKTIDGTKQTVKVFLKNGKTVDVAPEKLPNIATASSATILEAAGIKAPQSAAPSGPPKGENQKKGETVQ